MGAESRFAELKLTQSGIVLFGGVIKMSPRETTIRLETVPTDQDILSAGTPTELVIMARKKFYSTAGHIAAHQDGILTMVFDVPVTTTQRRGRPRHPLQTPVSMRSIHGDNCFGAWHNAESIDVSIGGMRLLVPGNIDIPSALEVQFMIEGTTYAVRGITEIGMEDAPLLPTPLIRASSRVVHCKRQARGDSIVGIAFTRIIPSDAMRLSQFCNSIAHA